MKDIPKYKIIENYILSQIKNGKLKRGDQIETEQKMSEKFNIGRLTVNKAMINLAQQGYIERIPGRGSFVRSNVITKKVSVKRSFTLDMKTAGLVPGSKLIDYKILKGSEAPNVAKYLALSDDDLIHYFIRLRTGNNDPIALSYTYISAKVVPAIDINCLNSSLNEYLNSIEIYSTATVHKMTAHIADAKQAKYLGITNANVALLRNAHVTYEKNRRPYEYIETYYISSKFEYMFSTGFADEENINPFNDLEQ